MLTEELRKLSRSEKILLINDLWEGKYGSSTFSVVLAQYPLLRRRNLSTYFERYYRNV